MATFRKRSGSWQALVKKKGFGQIARTFDTKGEAEAWAKVIEAEMVRGVYLSQKEAESTTLEESLDRYEREISSSKKGHLQEKKRIRTWKSHPLAKRFLASIQGKDIAAWRDARIKSGSSANTVRLDLAIISHLFEIARKEWGMEGLKNPVKSIRLPSPPSGRDRRLQPGELEKILESVSEEMGQVIRFALETAMRRGELAGMTWDMVDLKKRTVTLPETKTKNGQKRIVPLSSVAVTILKDRLSTRRIDGKVWNIGLDAISQDFAKACQKAEISDLHFHDLRHEATSRLFEKGFDTMEVRTITGHKTLQMLARYTHLRAEDLVERLK
ncbi:MAG: Integrase [Leptospirillum sp. Group II 'C75']|jgi:integrase|nr:site-specific integrase [Leptospirillum sp. Group II 'CF-1']AKS22747.1 integrase [Leptospirillum sp. Group II 'CF-1']EIJ77083.1 MAG: Integrase [Leptospirillum sp. Group II 'C75']